MASWDDHDALLTAIKPESFEASELLREMREEQVPNNLKRQMEEMERNLGPVEEEENRGGGVQFRAPKPTRVVPAGTAPEEDPEVLKAWTRALPSCLNDKQERDWPRRRSLDPFNDETKRLWRMPVSLESQGAEQCLSCECGLRHCKGTCAGRTIHDCVLCWSCRRAFYAENVPGFRKVLDAIENFVDDDKALELLLGWGRCPRCTVQLGASSLPTILAAQLKRVYDGSVANPWDTESISTVPDALLVEVDYCLDPKIGPPSVPRCTRAINALNKLRSIAPKPFYRVFAPLTRARLLDAHKLRAELVEITDMES